MKNSVGKKIKKLRELRNYTQSYMAIELDITQQGYSKIEKEGRLTVDQLDRIASILNVDSAYILNFDEEQLLKDVNSLLNRVDKLGFILCGHNIKNFDIPVLAKRMLVNGILPSAILPSYDTKPWEIKAIDTKEVWQYGQFGAISSLELMCISLGIESSKNMEVTGNKVHDSFWFENKYDEIQEYCEKDVEVLINVVTKIMSL
jgi:transcriptional regulator with XRE-family HTH domain